MKNRKNNFSFLILYSAFLILNFSCSTPGNIQNQNLAYLYQPVKQHFSPEFAVWNFSDDSSRLYVRLNPKEFLYTRSGENFTANFSIAYRLVESYENPLVIDSSRKSFSMIKKENSLSAIVTVDFLSNRNIKMLLECRITDVNKNVTDVFYLHVDRSSNQSRNSFLAATVDSVPFFRNFLSAADSFRIILRDTSLKQLRVNYYHRPFPLAAPPFSFDYYPSFDYLPDSVFTIDVLNYSAHNFPREGFYHIQRDTLSRNGLTLLRLHDDFPEQTNSKQLIESVRYLMTRKEFDELKNSPNPKGAVDKFWLDLGGNADRTRQLIRRYYSRVQFANEHFTSYQEGWKTDRGMIYIIFGAPHLVYRTSKSELWIYGDVSSSLSLNFTFIKVINPFTDNDFSLSRAPIYESSWYRAVDTWRQGRVFNDN
ncbi:MAG TPA: GWxTD domain-containing protein [Bacteroidia bacterium]|nr:GWxTD domain-containing protein [Bacteroidia bacterium]